MPNTKPQARARQRPLWPVIVAGVLALLLTASLRASLPLSSPPRPRLLRGHTGGVLSLAFSPDGRILASGSWDGTVRLWTAITGQSLGAPLTGHAGGIPLLAFRPDGKTLLSAGQDRTVRLWDVSTALNTGTSTKLSAGPVTAQPLGPPLNLPEPVDSLAFSPDGSLLAYGRCARWEKTWCIEGEIVLWSVATARPTGPPLACHEGIVESLAFSPDSRILASGSWDTTVRLWDTSAALSAGSTTGEPIGPPLEGHTDIVTCLAFSPDGATLASGGADRTIRLWNAETGQPIDPPLTGHTDIVMSVAYSPDGATLASGGYDGTVRLWDATSGLPIGPPLSGHDGPVTVVAFSPDGRTLASGGEDATIALWDLGAAYPERTGSSPDPTTR